MTPTPLEIGDRVATHEQDRFGRVVEVRGRSVRVDFGGAVLWLKQQQVIYAPTEEEIYGRLVHRFRGVVSGCREKLALQCEDDPSELDD